MLTASGRTGGDSSVQVARLAAAPTFVRRDGASLAGKSEAAAEAEARAGADEEGGEGAAKPQPGGKYGRQLMHFETMIQQNRSKAGKRTKVRLVEGADTVGLGGTCGHAACAADSLPPEPSC